MPTKILDRPSPPPGKSQLPDSILDLGVTLAAAMILLNDKFLLEWELRPGGTEPRLCGPLASGMRTGVPIRRSLELFYPSFT